MRKITFFLTMLVTLFFISHAFSQRTKKTITNTVPNFITTAITSVKEGEIYTYTIDASDVDGDVVSVTAPTKPNWLSLATKSGGEVTTFAGISGTFGHVDGTGTAATFGQPSSIVFDASGNLYIAEYGNHTIRKITPNGEVSTFAGLADFTGTTDGNGTSARFNLPIGLTIDASGNLYVTDQGNHSIRKVTPSGEVTTIAGSGGIGSADGNGTSASFNSPVGITVDNSGNLYVSDTGNHAIRKITPSGEVTTIAGTKGTLGTVNANGTSASFHFPYGIIIDSSENLYVAEGGNHTIRKITPNGDVTTLAGTMGVSGTTDGNGTNATFNTPTGMVKDKVGNIYVTDLQNHAIRKITPNGDVITIAGIIGTSGIVNGNGTSASLSQPIGVAINPSGNLFITEFDKYTVRKLTLPSATLTGDSTGNAGVHNVVLEANDGNGGITQQSFTITVKVAPSVTTNTVSLIGVNTATLNAEVTANGGDAITERGFVYALTSEDATPTLAEVNGTTIIKQVVVGTTGVFTKELTGLIANSEYSVVAYATNSAGTTEGSVQTFTTTNTAPTITSTAAATVNEGNTYNYVVTTNDADGDVVTVTAITKPDWLSLTTTSNVTTIAGAPGTTGAIDGNGNDALFDRPIGTAVDASGNLYIADTNNHRIRKITPSGEVSTFAGSTQGFADGTGTAAQFRSPRGIVIDASGNLYIADNNNHRIRKITPAGVVTTLAGSTQGYTDGTGVAAQFYFPSGLTIDKSGNLYVADQLNHRIRKVTPTGVVSTFAGSTAGFTNGNGTSAQFNEPFSIDIDASGSMYVVDRLNHSIRKITSSGEVSTLAGNGTGGFADGNGASAQFNSPFDVALDVYGNVYVADFINHRIRKITTTGEVSTVAGTGTVGNTNGAATEATFNFPAGLDVDTYGNIYVADYYGHAIRKITAPIITLTGDTKGSEGNHNVVLEANDGNGGVVQQTFTIEVKAKPTVVTGTVNMIAKNGATLQGTVINDGGATITERGFVYALTANDASPTLAEVNGTTVKKVLVSGTTETFNSAITGLENNRAYSVIAYATNMVGTTEGEVKTFNTLHISFEAVTKTYGEANFDLAAGSNSSGSISYAIVEGGTGSAELSGVNNATVNIGNAGTVTIRATQAAAGNFSTGSQDMTLTIEKATLTITPKQQTKTYGSNYTLTNMVSYTGFVNGDNAGDLAATPTVISLSDLEGNTTAGVNTYTEVLSVAAFTDSNYEITFGKGNFEITTKQLSVEDITGANKVYDGTITASVIGTANLVGVINSDNVSLAGTPVHNFVKATIGTNIEITTTGYSLTGADAYNYTVKQPNLSATITAKELEIVGLQGVNKVYDGTTNALATGTASLSGVIDGETVSVIGTPVYTFASKNVGLGIAITTTGYSLTGTDTSNYILTQPSLSGAITAKLITVTADAKTKEKGAEDPELTYQITTGELVGVDDFSGSLEREEGEEVGDYVIRQGTLAVSDNYSITYKEALFTITKALSIREFSVNTDITLYPNPTSGIVNIKSEKGIAINKVVLYNVLGRALNTFNKEVLDISTLKAGTYILRIETEKGVGVKRIVKD
ncbi:conserved protein of unknown function precursor containing a T9SS type A C-terminal secretion signal [Tenacibaculum sp. 190524A02b]|uniref:NHL domain-containing protein n=1 Tax=Tenacibaculum vairaonense TaxID=3137860 RepID=UPI0032B11CD7